MRFLGSLLVVLSLGLAVPRAFAGDWRAHQASLGSKQGKMKAAEAEIEDLIHQKKGAEDPDEVTRLTGALAERHEGLARAAQEYREERLHVRFKHPERGDESERKYPRYQLKTLKEMEAGHGLDAKLDGLRERLRRTFGVKSPEGGSPGIGRGGEQGAALDPVRKVEPARGPAAREKRPAEADERIRLSK